MRCTVAQGFVALAGTSVLLLLVAFQWTSSVNSDHERLHPPSAADVRRGWETFMANEVPATPPETAFEVGKRGIVLSGGHHALVQMASLVKSIRVKGCTLPIEIWHDDEVSLLDSALLSLALEDDQLTFHSFRSVPELQRYLPFEYELAIKDNNKPYMAKVAAIFYSSFEEVLWLDNDCIAVADLTTLFESQSYKDTGTLLWPSGVINGNQGMLFYPNFLDPAVISATLPHDDEKRTLKSIGAELDSGHGVMHKTKQWQVLNLVLYFNLELFPFFYHHLHGDKDTFLFAHRALDSSFSLMPVGMLLGYPDHNDDQNFCATAILQRDEQKNPVIIHGVKALAPIWNDEAYVGKPWAEVSEEMSAIKAKEAPAASVNWLVQLIDDLWGQQAMIVLWGAAPQLMQWVVEPEAFPYMHGLWQYVRYFDEQNKEMTKYMSSRMALDNDGNKYKCPHGRGMAYIGDHDTVSASPVLRELEVFLSAWTMHTRHIWLWAHFIPFAGLCSAVVLALYVLRGRNRS